MDSVTLVDSIGPSFGAFLYLWTVDALGYLLEETFIVRYINIIVLLNHSKRLITILKITLAWTPFVVSLVPFSVLTKFIFGFWGWICLWSGLLLLGLYSSWSDFQIWYSFWDCVTTFGLVRCRNLYFFFHLSKLCIFFMLFAYM